MAFSEIFFHVLPLEAVKSAHCRCQVPLAEDTNTTLKDMKNEAKGQKSARN